MNGLKFQDRLIAKMKKLLFGIGIVLFALVVLGFDMPDASISIEDFLLLDNESLYNFSINFTGVEEGVTEDYYYFTYIIWQPYTYTFDIDEDAGTYNQITLMKQQRKLEYFACSNTIDDCTTAYNSFIESYKNWWVNWYNEFKGGYN